MTNHPANKNKILFRISALLLAGCSFGVGAQDDLSLNIQANILETTCQLTVQNGGAIHLPTVSVNYFPTGVPRLRQYCRPISWGLSFYPEPERMQ